jgi:hypothetical protein
VNTFLAQGLGIVGIIPDIGLFQFALYLNQPFTVASIVKDTP